MLSLQRSYKLAARAYMASCILARYSWCKVTDLSDSQRIILTSMKFRLMAVLGVFGRKRYDINPIPADTLSCVYFLGFWQEDRLALIQSTIRVIDIALSGTWPVDRNQFQQAMRYLEEVSLYAWRNETIRITNETDSQHLLPMLDLLSK